MGHIRYDASTPGGALVATATAKLLSAIEDFKNAKGLCDQVGNMTDPFAASNFEDTNNVVFDVNTSDAQAFFDQVSAIDTALTTFLATDGNEGRLYALYQSE